MSFKEEFHPSKFGLKHHAPKELQIPLARNIHPGVLLGLRLQFSIYTIIMMVVSVQSSTGPWIMYITTWNYIVVTAHFIVGFLATLSHIAPSWRGKSLSSQEATTARYDVTYNSGKISIETGQSQDEPVNGKDGPNILLKVSWVLFTISLNFSIVIILLYWVSIHDFSKDKFRDTLKFYLIIDRHGINTVLILVDFIFNAAPVRILHFIYPVILALIYFITNVIYVFSAETVLYKAYDFKNKPGQAIGLSLASFLMLAIAQFFWYWIYRLKLKIAKKEYKTLEGKESDTEAATVDK